MKKKALLFVTAFALALGGGMQLHAASKLADTVYHNGKIYTITETLEEAKNVQNAQKADVVATLDGKIVFVGSKSDAQKKGYLDVAKVGKIVDLRGKTMLPGFVDGHSHFPGDSYMDLYYTNLNCPPLGAVVDMDDLIALVKAKAESTPEGFWVQGMNYDDSLIAEKRHPTRWDLDKASTAHPVKVTHSSGHMCSVNSNVIEYILKNKGTVERVDGLYVFKKTDGAIESGVDIDQSTGEPTGVLRESAGNLTNGYGTFAPIDNDWLNARGSQNYTAAGVTTADLGGTAIATALPGYQQSYKKGLMGVRLVLHPSIATTSNHIALKWDTNGTEDPAASSYNPTSLLDDKVTADSPNTGTDITKYKAPNAIADVDMTGQPDSLIFLGAWKQFYDGSPQGYTALFKLPGYWDKQGQNGFDPEYNNGEGKDLGPDGPLLGLGGTSKIPFPQLVKGMNLYHKNGQSVETHTNGPLAAESLMTALELAVAQNPGIKDSRHTFIHGQTEERQIVERTVGNYASLDSTANMYGQLNGTALQEGTVAAADGTEYTAQSLRAALNNGELIRNQNLITSYFVNHTYFWGDRHYNIYFGPGRARMISPTGWANYYGHIFTTHNDTPVTPISPLRSVNSCVNRVTTGGMILNGDSKDIDAKIAFPELKGGNNAEFWDYDQRVNALQALRATTIYPAYQNKIENLVGSIEEGKFADFVILDKDPLAVAEEAPLTLADLRIATTIMGDTVSYGVLPDSDIFIGQLHASYGQADGVTISDFSYKKIATAEAEKNYGAIGKGENRLGTVEFTANVTEGKSGVFQMSFLGNGATAGEFKLYKLHANATDLYTYGKPAAADMDSASGHWWIADLAAPLAPLAATDKLEMDKTYLAFFVIRDNDEVFDADTTPGVIKDPVSLASTGVMPTNGNTGGSEPTHGGGGSSSGCTVSATPSYDMLLLFLGFTAVAAIRILRKKESN